MGKLSMHLLYECWIKRNYFLLKINVMDEQYYYLDVGLGVCPQYCHLFANCNKHNNGLVVTSSDIV